MPVPINPRPRSPISRAPAPGEVRLLRRFWAAWEGPRWCLACGCGFLAIAARPVSLSPLQGWVFLGCSAQCPTRPVWVGPRPVPGVPWSPPPGYPRPPAGLVPPVSA